MALPPPICNNKVTNSRYPWILAASLAAILWVAPLTANATALQFTLETPSLSGATAYLAFDFINGDGVVNNTVTISDFATDGTLGVASPTGGASGTLIPGPVTLTDTDLFNSFLQALTLGASLSFTVNLTEQPSVALFPDSFAFSLLNDSAFAAVRDHRSVWLGCALCLRYRWPIQGDAIHLCPERNRFTVTWAVGPVASVPLPSTVWLLGAGLLGGLAVRRRGGLHTVEL